MINMREREDVKKDQKNQITNYFRDELNEAVFVKLKKDLTKLLSENNHSTSKQEIMFSKGYFDVREEILEFHVNYAEIFNEIAQNWPLKGHCSIRRNPNFRAHVVIGQDESIFLPHSLKNRDVRWPCSPTKQN